MYTDEFIAKPQDFNSADLNFFIVHPPIARKAFSLDDHALLKIESESEKELEGYNYYLDTMQKQ